MVRQFNADNKHLHSLRQHVVQYLKDSQPVIGKHASFGIPRLLASVGNGAFEGNRAQFAEWWIKLQIWVKANWDAFADDFEVATVVLSQLKGPVVGQYAQAERDWACQQICSFKQGNMKTDDYVTRFLALSIQGGLGNEHAVELLERNVNPRITEQIYLQNTRSENLALAAEEVRRVGRAMELYAMHQV
ncbi:hypothetical protein SERLADRAFT_437775 [Serpula lacrymans var. lacrymans S7.9]|uniref:Retrotransposon gag domain-containing protein n=1 Tax=Serpula lacrymans var. lacrymans (strain S7.9) TaxID=578457 RepID=F8NVE2_SERL9|nr:uncharacterized protein SERLADRAFT_437775 [Serpula lacrymans var. lacrymans S7.9]EGO26043.1 hypothetical protein SERLADRAFT_437775 [Serpula lacrymans var. lacrymans S7.9]